MMEKINKVESCFNWCSARVRIVACVSSLTALCFSSWLRNVKSVSEDVRACFSYKPFGARFTTIRNLNLVDKQATSSNLFLGGGWSFWYQDMGVCVFEKNVFLACFSYKPFGACFHTIRHLNLVDKPYLLSKPRVPDRPFLGPMFGLSDTRKMICWLVCCFWKKWFWPGAESPISYFRVGHFNSSLNCINRCSIKQKIEKVDSA